jgi:hypothetical protein
LTEWWRWAWTRRCWRPRGVDRQCTFYTVLFAQRHLAFNQAYAHTCTKLFCGRDSVMKYMLYTFPDSGRCFSIEVDVQEQHWHLFDAVQRRHEKWVQSSEALAVGLGQVVCTRLLVFVSNDLYIRDRGCHDLYPFFSRISQVFSCYCLYLVQGLVQPRLTCRVCLQELSNPVSTSNVWVHSYCVIW